MPSHPTRTTFFILILIPVLAFLLAACSMPTLGEPAATPAPTPITTPFAGVREDPQRLTLIQTDLPDGFRKLENTTLHEGHNAVLFMNADAISGKSDQNVLGVVDEITTYEDDADARDAFENDLMLTEQDIANKIQESESTTPGSIKVQTYHPDLTGVDLLRAFKASYKLGDTAVNEYRYQFMVSNAIGNVIVTVRADGDGGESKSGREQADAIAQAQIDKLNQYRAERPE
jgi:hypothetical protein